MNRSIVMMIGLALLLLVTGVLAGDKPTSEQNDSSQTATAQSTQVQQSDQVVVYYLHMNRRCMTCNKLEAYSKEAVETGFANQLQDSSIIFRSVNFETKGNEHFAKDYQLYSQSLILSRQHDGEETEWENLDKIWTLVDDKDEFVTYVQTEIADFLSSKEKE